jgi:hypothetical protein
MMVLGQRDIPVTHYRGAVNRPNNTETVPTSVTSSDERVDAVKSIQKGNMTANLVVLTQII